MSTCGRSRLSQPGIHQLPAPARNEHCRREQKHGHGRECNADREPDAELLHGRVVVDDEAAEDGHHDQRRCSDHAGASRETAGHRLPGAFVGGAVMLDLADEEDLIVHREAEQDGEHHQRHVARNRVGSTRGIEADEAQPPSPLKHRREDAERRRDRQDVGDGRLGRDDERAECGEQQRGIAKRACKSVAETAGRRVRM
jgi:hypothetical protein